tara:strand:- start:1013 stop:1441 length:429 start_codon:yes stop_codon:yes gene_type:complete
MSVTAGLFVGKAIFNILSNGITASVQGMTLGKIQPMPMLDQGSPEIGVLYEVSGMLPINIKRLYRVITAPVYMVDISIEVIHIDYSTCTALADAVCQDLQGAAGTYNTIKVNGFNLDGMQEGYNKERKYYSKLMSFQARVLL